MPRANFGVQPIKQILAERLIPVRALANVLEIPYPRMYRAVNGVTCPPPDMLELLSGYLKLAPEELFTKELLDRGFGPRLGGRPRVSAG